MNIRKYAKPIVIILFISISFGLGMGLLTAGSEVLPTIASTAEMTAYGTFDRIELVDRHFGDYNGKEVEGKSLAVLYQNGSTEISANHYEVRNYWPYYEDGINFPFFLYVYDDVNHLRERISVVGNTTEEYIYLNVTVTIALTHETSKQVNNAMSFETASATFSGIAAIIGSLIWYFGIRIDEEERE